MPLGNLGTNIRITAAAPGVTGSFPFNAGSWASTGYGWETVPADGGNITQEVGATSKNTIATAGTNNIYAIGSVTYFGHQSFIIVLDSAPSGWNQIKVTPDGGASTIYSLTDGDLTINPTFSDHYTLIWARNQLDFTNGVSGVCVFNDNVQPANYTWNAATGNPAPTTWLAAACDTSGNTLAGWSDGSQIHIYKSTDGGNSFSHVVDITETHSLNQISYNGRGNWYLSAGTAAGGLIYQSQNVGASWASVGPLGGQNPGAIGSDGNGTNAFCSANGIATAYYDTSLHLGANMSGNLGTEYYGCAWDATQSKFFAIGGHSGAGDHVYLGLSTTSWADQGAMNAAGSTHQMWASSWKNGSFGQNALIDIATATIYMSAQILNNFCLTKQKNQSVPASSSGGGSIANDGNGNWQWFDDAGVGANSADGIYWAGNAPNFAVGDYGAVTVYDSFHTAFIVFGGNGGGIFTTASAPAGIVITPNPVTMNLGDGLAFSETGDDGSGVIWSVNGIVGGNATVGTINSVGNYLSPTQAQFIADGGPLTVTIGCANADGGPSPGTAAVTFNLPLITAYGLFRGQKAFKPVSLANVGAIEPKIYAPAENITVKRRP